jgi:hypothetical protein
MIYSNVSVEVTMFSMRQKQEISAAVEKLLLSYNHPEMPSEKPRFVLHVHGAEDWSYAVIEPNWTFNDKNKPGINPHNEAQDKGGNNG